MISHNTFAGAFVDRSGHRRQDAEWLARAMQDRQTLFVPVWGDRCLAGGTPPRAVLLTLREAAAFLDGGEPVFLGMFRGLPAFAFHIAPGDEPPCAGLGDFHDLRYLGSVLPADEANLVAHARALIVWHGLQKYCGLCGAPSRAESGGNVRICGNAECRHTIFPRVDPAIIVLVSNGEQCLLGRQAAWPEGRYSTIAGFVEPGESLEDAVKREVFEETNVEVHTVRYHSSQPWPFPSSLMLGFTAAATSTDIVLNDGELEDARWFTRKELRSGFPGLPYRLSIARRLIDDWLDGEE
ncbi:MAG: NAD(+) diphosphatase [Woeseiaceae bacterium]